jgi:hypothetical protein
MDNTHFRGSARLLGIFFQDFKADERTSGRSLGVGVHGNTRIVNCVWSFPTGVVAPIVY